MVLGTAHGDSGWAEGSQATLANSINPDSPHPRGLVGMPTWKGVFGGFCGAKARSSRETHWESRAVSAPTIRTIFQGVVFISPPPSLPSRAQETLAILFATVSWLYFIGRKGSNPARPDAGNARQNFWRAVPAYGRESQTLPGPSENARKIIAVIFLGPAGRMKCALEGRISSEIVPRVSTRSLARWRN